MGAGDKNPESDSPRELAGRLSDIMKTVRLYEGIKPMQRQL